MTSGHPLGMGMVWMWVLNTKMYSIYENELYFYDIRAPNIRDSTNIPLVGEAVGFAFGLRVNVGETEGMMLKK